MGKKNNKEKKWEPKEIEENTLDYRELAKPEETEKERKKRIRLSK